MNIKRSKLVNLNDGIKESKKNVQSFYSLESSESIINPNDYYQKMHDFSELINQGSSLVLNNNFNEAINIYQKSLNIAESLKDEYQKNEIKCNIGIINFYLSKLNEAINYIQPCYNYIYSICQSENGMNSIRNLYLLCKSGANLCMCQLTINSENNNCTSLINDIINIVSKEDDLYKQLFCVKYLNNILFRVNTLLTKKNDLIIDKYSYDNINLSNNFIIGNEEIYNQINEIFIKSFDSFMATQKIEPWINSLNIIYQKMQQLKDYNGIIYILFNRQLAVLLKNYNNIKNSLNEEVNDAKLNLIALLKAVNQVNIENENNFEDELDSNPNNNELINEEYINNIFEDYKLKIFVIRNIYKMLYSFEEKVNQKIQEDDNDYNNMQNQKYVFNINSEVYLKLLLYYTINYFKENIQDVNLKKALIQDVNNTIDLIVSKKIDISEMNMSSIDPEISKSLTLILNNLFRIYNHFKLLKYFKKMKIISKYKKQKKKPDPELNKKLENFFERNYNYIYKGEKIQKINFNSNAVKEHFYQIDYQNDYFQSFGANNSSKKSKNFDFDDILKIVVGLKTNNVIHKINSLKIKTKNKPYLFMSLIFRKRTIDLVFKNEGSAKNWFYGFFHYLSISDRNYKIGSCTKYILFRLKCKMIKKLEDNIANVDYIPFSSCMIKYFKTLGK